MRKFVGTLMLIMFVGQEAALAYDLKKSKNEAVSAVFHSEKSIYDIERCLIEIDLVGAPIVYRAPDRPNESIVYRATPEGASHVMELKSVEGHTILTVKNRSTPDMQRDMKVCL